MARPALYLSPEAEAMWEDLCARWQVGTITVPEIAGLLEFSETTIYQRLHDAEQRLECRQLDANQAAFDARRTGTTAADDPGRPGISLDDGTYLTLTSDPLDEVYPVRDYSRDRIHGEPRYRVRDHYDLNSDRCTLDDVGGTVLVGGGAIRYNSAGAGRQRLPSPPIEGQRLKRGRLGAGSKAADKIRNHAPDPDGLEGGQATEPAPKGHRWIVAPPDVESFTVDAKNERGAKRRAKERLGLPLKSPLPAGTRIRCEG